MVPQLRCRQVPCGAAAARFRRGDGRDGHGLGATPAADPGHVAGAKRRVRLDEDESYRDSFRYSFGYSFGYSYR